MSNRVIPYNFGALPPLPDGYAVCWYGCHEHYMATGPDDWEGDISVDPHWCRRQAIAHATRPANVRPAAAVR